MTRRMHTGRVCKRPPCRLQVGDDPLQVGGAGRSRSREAPPRKSKRGPRYIKQYQYQISSNTRRGVPAAAQVSSNARRVSDAERRRAGEEGQRAARVAFDRAGDGIRAIREPAHEGSGSGPRSTWAHMRARSHTRTSTHPRARARPASFARWRLGGTRRGAWTCRRCRPGMGPVEGREGRAGKGPGPATWVGNSVCLSQSPRNRRARLFRARQRPLNRLWLWFRNQMCPSRFV